MQRLANCNSGIAARANCSCKTEGVTKLSEKMKESIRQHTTAQVAEMWKKRLRTHTGAHEAEIGSYLCCGGGSLQKQCTWCDILKSEVIFFWLHDALILTSWISCNMSREQNFVPTTEPFRKTGEPHKENCRWNMLLPHVPTTSLVCHSDECTSKQSCNQSNLFKTTTLN